MKSLEAMAAAKLKGLEKLHLRRDPKVSDRLADAIIERDGRRLISFSCNDYLNLSHDPRVIEAAVEATRRYGAGAGASRLVTGNHPLLVELEARLARLKDTEDCIVFGSGYLANTGILPALVGSQDLILADELSHACLLSGAKMAGAKTLTFRHNDMEHLKALLEAHRSEHPHCLVVTDGVFSMDGDLAPLPEMAALCEAFDAWLLSDDAHGVGIVGSGGRGSSFAFGEKVNVPLQMGTLSKAIGGYGGYLCASKPVVDLMRNRARTFVFSTGLPPASAAAAIAALDIIESEPALCARPAELARLFCWQMGLPAPQSPIVPVIVGEAEKAVALSKALEAEGFLVAAIRPPTVPRGTARLRFTFTARHREEDIERLTETLQRLMETEGEAV